jgi:glycosyltransferase involved in cell wall biosynthesis
MNKHKVILHDIEYTVGGPKTVLNGIVQSPLRNDFEFVRLKQTESCGFSPVKAIKFVNHYRKAINAEKADSIYICGLQYTGLLMTIAAKLSNVKKVVVSVHGSDWDNPDGSLRKWILMHIVEPLTVMLADAVFTVCEAAQKTIGALKAAPTHNAGVVYNTFPSVDITTIAKGKFRSSENIGGDKILVSIVGRVVQAKGHQYIIEAIKKLNDSQYIFAVVGDGPYLEKYKELCDDEIKSGRVKLLGARSDVYEILRDSDIFLFATLNENHSIALLETVNMKCAALVTNVGGNPEIIENGKSGLLIPPKNSDAIVKGLKILSDSKLRQCYAENAFNVASNKFSIENTYGNLKKILTP